MYTASKALNMQCSDRMRLVLHIRITKDAEYYTIAGASNVVWFLIVPMVPL